jgi:hypothetical protein
LIAGTKGVGFRKYTITATGLRSSARSKSWGMFGKNPGDTSNAESSTKLAEKVQFTAQPVPLAVATPEDP